MRILLMSILCIFAVSCSSGTDDFGANPTVQRLILSSFTPGGDEIELNVQGSSSGAFPAVTYFVYGTDTDMGEQAIVPLRIDRHNEQAFGPFAFGDAPQRIDLTPWENYNSIYLRAISVTPSYGWKMYKGKIYNFSTN